MSTAASGVFPPLGEAGAALYGRLAGAYEFTATEEALLVAACRQADDITMLEATLAEEGPIVAGSKGQPRLSPVLAELRQGRLAFAKLLGALAVPDDFDDKPLTANSRRARAAANARWNRVRAEEARRGSPA